MPAQQYRKRPVVVEAIRFTGGNIADISRFTGHGKTGPGVETVHFYSHLPGKFKVWNESHRDWNVVNIGDWIIRGTAGEFYPCEPDIFKATYERVS